MKLTQYECRPKKAKSPDGEAWWYARRGGIDIYVDGKYVFIKRARLVEYVNRTKKV